jgi:hypothetical protein
VSTVPSEHQQAANSAIPAYPTFEERLGENPARFLCSDMSPWPILRGIETFERASAYLAVARAEGADERVVRALEHTKEAVREGSEA